MSLAKLEKSLGYEFKNAGLLERAVSHRSWAHENLPGESGEKLRGAQNESLEFVGDSVLGLVIAEHLFTKHPTLAEGDLTLMKHRLVSTATLAKIADSIKLGKAVRMGRGEEKTGGRKKQAILADTLEAVFGAVFFDGGYSAARESICRVFNSEFDKVTPGSSIDYKTLLQETLQSEKLSAPSYSIVKTEGLPHDRMFTVEAAWPDGKAEGTGTSIKSAEMMAAQAALKAITRKKSRAAKRKQPAERMLD